MKNILTTVIIVVLIGGIAFVALQRDPEAPTNNAEDNAVSFTLQTYDGETVTRSEIDSEILVVNSWASWCPFCVDELPDFVQLQEAYPEAVSVIAINRAEPRSIALEYLNQFGGREAIVFLEDPEDSFYRSIGGFTMPETVFLNARGEILEHKRGPFDFEAMSEIVDRLLAQ